LDLEVVSRKGISFPKKLTAGNIEVDFKGDVRVRLLNDKWLEVAKLGRSDLTLNVNDLGKEVHLTFSKTF
jgi:hypothetical protein